MDSALWYRAFADAAAIAHLAFLVYVVCGGFLAWRYPRTIALHLAAAGWGFTGLLVGIDCPLTRLESWARVRAGQAPLPSSGFIDHYLTGVLYPEAAAGVVQILVALAVVAAWVGCAVLRVRARVPLSRTHWGGASQ